MATSKVNLSTTEYVRINIGLYPLVLQAHRDSVRVVVSNAKPSKQSSAFIMLDGGDPPLNLGTISENVWALAVSNRSSLIVTELADLPTDGTVAKSYTTNPLGLSTSQNVIVQNQSLSQFGEVLTISRSPIIELNSSYGVSSIRDVVALTGGGSASDGAGEIILSTSAAPTSSVRIKSAESGVYIAGYGAEIGIGMRFPNAPTGNQVALWGGLTNLGNDALRFGYDSTGVYISRLRNSIEATKVYQSSWNQDKLDGTGKSGFNLNMSGGTIFQIDFTWYGYGQIQWGVIAVVDGQQKFIAAHSEKVVGESSIESPNLQVFSQVDNGGDATDFTSYLGGRQYSVIGRYVPNFRYTGSFRVSTNTSTTRIPLITFRGKTGFLDRRVLLDAIDAGVASADVIIEVILGGTLTGETFGNPTGHAVSETALEVDTAATAITGGVLIYSDYLTAGAGNKINFSTKDASIPIPIENNITLAVRTLTGTGTITSFFRMKEEW